MNLPDTFFYLEGCGKECNPFHFRLFILCSLSVGFDLISQFQVDKAASRRAIQRVVGSTALQVAYKLGNNADFRIPTRYIKIFYLIICLKCIFKNEKLSNVRKSSHTESLLDHDFI